MMKKFILFIAIFLIHGSVFAISPILIQVKTFGGYVHPDYAGHEEGISIYYNGQIEFFQLKNIHSRVKKVLLGKLSNSALQTLMKKVEDLPQGELVSETPGAPMCMDLPITNYSLWKRSGLSFVFSRSADCHKFFIEGSEARNLQKLLEGLRILRTEVN